MAPPRCPGIGELVGLSGVLAHDLGLIDKARVEWFMETLAEVQTMLCVMLTDQEMEDRAPASLTMVQ